MKYKSYCHWLEANLKEFFTALDIDFDNRCPGIINAHGNECYRCRDIWNKNGIPFEHGIAIYLLSYIHPYSNIDRGIKNGWINPCSWVIEKYSDFAHLLAEPSENEI